MGNLNFDASQVAPTTAFARWRRLNHIHHHFREPRMNHGVTSPVWDVVARTYDDPGVVTVPRRMAPTWMLDPDGELLPAYAGDYLLKGRRRLDDTDRSRDRDDAFANRAPVPA